MRYLTVFDDPYPDVESLRPYLPTLTLTTKYPITPPISPRILEVEKQFSLGEIAEDFTVFNGFRLEFNDGDVIYITGESGGGKSTLLKAFKRLYEPKCIDLADIQPNQDEVLVDGVGDDINDALYILNNVGLGEAWLFIRRYGELSDGQKLRYRLAKAIYFARKMGLKALLSDEFCSMLDRITAKVVAYLTQKLARRYGLTLIVATAHEDLFEDLNPDIFIVKPFLKPPIVKRFKYEPKECSLMKDIHIESGTFKDYEALEVYHYKGHRPAFPKKVFKAVYRDKLVGVIVYTNSYLNIRGRNIVFGSPLTKMAQKGEILRIARVVVDPRFRGIGLGSRLVRETLEKTNAKIIETLAAMAVYNPFFEKAGMRLGYVYEPKSKEKVLERYRSVLQRYGFNPDLIHRYSHLKQVVDQMDDETLKSFERELYGFSILRVHGKNIEIKRLLKNGEAPKSKLPTYMMQFASLTAKTYYYYWINPAYASEFKALCGA